MKKVHVVFAVILTTLFMSCGGNGNGSKEVTLTDKASGAEITATDNQQKVPDGFPSDIFIVKGTIDHVTTVDMGGQKNVSIIMHTEMSPKEVRAEILKNMEANGWTTKMNVGSQQYFSKGEETLKTGIVKDDNKTGVTYIATY